MSVYLFYKEVQRGSKCKLERFVWWLQVMRDPGSSCFLFTVQDSYSVSVRSTCSGQKGNTGRQNKQQTPLQAAIFLSRLLEMSPRSFPFMYLVRMYISYNLATKENGKCNLFIFGVTKVRILLLKRNRRWYWCHKKGEFVVRPIISLLSLFLAVLFIRKCLGQSYR